MSDVYNVTEFPYMEGDIIKITLKTELFRTGSPSLVKQKNLHFKIIANS